MLWKMSKGSQFVTFLSHQGKNVKFSSSHLKGQRQRLGVPELT